MPSNTNSTGFATLIVPSSWTFLSIPLSTVKNQSHPADSAHARCMASAAFIPNPMISFALDRISGVGAISTAAPVAHAETARFRCLSGFVNSPTAIQTTMHIQRHHYASKLELTTWLQSQDGQMAASGHRTGDCSSSCRDKLSCRILPAGARTEDPKLFGLVLPRDSVDFITLRAYLVQHAHKKTSILYHILRHRGGKKHCNSLFHFTLPLPEVNLILVIVYPL